MTTDSPPFTSSEQSRTPMPRLGRRLAIAAAVPTALLVGLTGCGDGGSGSASGTTEAAPSAETVEDTRAEAGADDFCDADAEFDAVFAGVHATDDLESIQAFYEEQLTPVIERRRGAAPAELSDSVDTVTAAMDEAVATGDFDLLEGDDVNRASAEMDEFVYENCDGEQVEVTTVDYAFEGLPDELPAGPVLLRMVNAGDEFHEVAVIRRLPGTTQPTEELLQMPEEEVVGTLVEFLGQVEAEPGGSDVMQADLEPGEYIIACFVPTGSVDGHEGDGPPHLMEGMVRDITVA